MPSMGKRNLPPYVQDFWQAGYKPHNYGYSEGKSFTKQSEDNDYFTIFRINKVLKKATAAYEKAGSVGPIVYYNQAIITIGLVDLEEPIQ